MGREEKCSLAYAGIMLPQDAIWEVNCGYAVGTGGPGERQLGQAGSVHLVSLCLSFSICKAGLTVSSAPPSVAGNCYIPGRYQYYHVRLSLGTDGHLKPILQKLSFSHLISSSDKCWCMSDVKRLPQLTDNVLITLGLIVPSQHSPE